MFGFEFANPKYFLLLVLLLPMILWYVFKEKKSHADLQFSSLRAFRGIRHAGRVWLRHVLFCSESSGYCLSGYRFGASAVQ